MKLLRSLAALLCLMPAVAWGAGASLPPAPIFVSVSRGNLVLGPSTYNPFNTAPANLWNTAAGIGALAGNPGSGTNTAFGHNAIGAMAGTTGGGAAAFGDNALSNTQAPYNTGIGSNAGRAWTTGSGGNIAIGHGAAGQDDFSPALATGAYNTFVGSWSAQEITTGGANSCFGMNSCMQLTTGSQNAVLGQGALAGTTANTATATGDAASNNTALGYNALQSTTSNGQVGVGFRALVANTTGTLSTALGYNALQSSVADNNNTAVGNGALFTLNGANSNTAVGSQAGAKATTATQNAFVGDYAGYNITTGSQNTAIGSGAMLAAGAAAFNNVVAIGYQATPSQSNQVVLGNTSTTQNTLYGSLGVGSGGYIGFTGGAAVTSANFSLFGNGSATVVNAPSGTGFINFAAGNTTVAKIDATSGVGKLQVLFSTASTSTTTGSFVTAGGAGIAGALYLGGVANLTTGAKLGAFTVATLPTCNAGNQDLLLTVTDATSPTYRGTLTGGGAVRTPVYCDGSSWTSH